MAAANTMILSRIQQLQIRIEQSNEVAQSIKSPRATHEDELAAIHQSARQELENLSLQGSVSQEVLISSSEKVMIYGGQAQKLKDVYNARAKDEEAAYEHALEEIWKKLCVDLCEVFGSRLIDEVLQEQRRPNASPRASSSSSSSNNDSTSQESRASDASHGGSPSESPSLRPTEATTSNLNETGEQQRRHQPLGNPKRKGAAHSGPSNRAKRVRKESEKSTEETINFEDVYQDGQADIKHSIVQFPVKGGPWYILRCRKHDLMFNSSNPIQGAAKHLDSEAHGRISREYILAVQHFGVRVLNCNARLAEKNNFAVKRALQRKPGTKKRKYSAAHSLPKKSGNVAVESISNDSRPRRANRFEGISHPIPGEVYLGYFNGWFAVLLLPPGPFESIGVPGSIQETGLLDQEIPECYQYDPETETLTWQDDFKDDGASVSLRKFPVMFFDGLAFPEKSSVTWLDANDLRPLDIREDGLRLVPNYRVVKEFLQKRGQPDVQVSQPPDAASNCAEADSFDQTRRNSYDTPKRNTPPTLPQSEEQRELHDEHVPHDAVPGVSEADPVYAPLSDGWSSAISSDGSYLQLPDEQDNMSLPQRTTSPPPAETRLHGSGDATRSEVLSLMQTAQGALGISPIVPTWNKASHLLQKSRTSVFPGEIMQEVEKIRQQPPDDSPSNYASGSDLKIDHVGLDEANCSLPGPEPTILNIQGNSPSAIGRRLASPLIDSAPQLLQGFPFWRVALLETSIAESEHISESARPPPLQASYTQSFHQDMVCQNSDPYDEDFAPCSTHPTEHCVGRVMEVHAVPGSLNLPVRHGGPSDGPSDGPYSCYHCGKVYVREGFLSRHLEMKHSSAAA